MDLSHYKLSDLLELHRQINEELRLRNIVRTANNPIGDLAEWLFCRAFNWKMAPNSEKSFDADDGTYTYQIKARRLHHRNSSRQMSAIRDLDGFDFLAVVLFDENYRIVTAAIIPNSIVQEETTHTQHTNSHRFILRDKIFQYPSVRMVTETLKKTIEDA